MENFYTLITCCLQTISKSLYNGGKMVDLKPIYTIVVILSFMLNTSLQAQTYAVPTSGSSVSFTCSGTIRDNGGTGNYANNADGSRTITPGAAGQSARLTFTEFNLENNYDYVYIYNGNSTASPQVAGSPFSGTALPPVITSTAPDGSLTIRLDSDGSVTRAGFAATISCVSSAPPCAGSSITLTMNDSYGDGWNGGSITLTNDLGNTFGPFSIGASSGTETLCLPDGCYSINMVPGSWPGEITWSLSNGVSGNGSYGNQSSVFTIGSGSCGPPPSACDNITPIACGQTANGSTAGALGLTVPFCSTSSGSGGVNIYSYTGTGDIVTASLCGSSYDTKIWVFTGSCTGTLNCVVGNDDFCGLQSQVEFTSTPGVEYLIVVGGFGSATGNYTLSLSCVSPCTPATAPTGIAGSATICSGSSTTLSISGGSAGSDAVGQWFAGSCGSAVIGTGNSISVSPTVNTTYFVRYVGSCNTTSCASVSVNVNQPSTAPTIAGPTPVCPGTDVTINAAGGTAGTGSAIHWYTGPNGTGTSLGTGASYTIPSVTSTQTIYARRQGTCNTTGDASFTVVADAPQTLGNNADSRTCVVNQNSFVHFTQNGRLIASVNSNGQNLGNVTATSYVHGSPLDVPSCDNPQAPQFNTAVLGRSWVITPTNQPSSDVTVRLYFDINEYNALDMMANSNQSAEDNVVSLADLMLTKYNNSTTPALVNNSPLDNCPSGQSTIHAQVTFNQASSAITGFDNNGFYTEYTIPSFSEFWLHGSSNMTPLPVTLTYFDTYCDNNRVNIVWQTASENNSSYFVVQKSEDGQDWREVGQLNAAGHSNVVNNYELEDKNLTSGATYYRLLQVDLDGEATLYDPIMSDCEIVSSATDVVIYPNPTVNESQVRITNAVQGKGVIQVVDLTGKVLTRYDVLFENTMHYQTINANDLAKGSYMLHVSFSDGSRKAVSFVKQ